MEEESIGRSARALRRARLSYGLPHRLPQAAQLIEDAVRRVNLRHARETLFRFRRGNTA